MLFYILKDQIGSKLSKVNIKKKLENLTCFVCPVRSREVKKFFHEGDISKEFKILESLFNEDEKQIGEQLFIQRLFKKTNETLHMLCILELLILPLTFGIEKKMKNKIYKMPLIFINVFELHKQSHSQFRQNQIPQIKVPNDPINPSESPKIQTVKIEGLGSLQIQPYMDNSNKHEKMELKEIPLYEENDPPKKDQSSIPRTNKVTSGLALLSKGNSWYGDSFLDLKKSFQELSPRIGKVSHRFFQSETIGSKKVIPKHEKAVDQIKFSKKVKEPPDSKIEPKKSPKILKKQRVYKELDTKVPLGIQMLCRELIKKTKNLKMDDKKFEELIWSKPNKSICQAIQSAFELGLASSLSTKFFGLSEILHTLKKSLLELPEPLMTWSLSIEALSISLDSQSIDKRNSLKNLYQSLPSSHLSTIRCLVDCFSCISQGDPKIQTLLSSFFGNCFVRFSNSDDLLAYSPFEQYSLNTKMETTPKEFVNFLLDQKEILSFFDFSEMANSIDENLCTPFLKSILFTSNCNLSYSDQYLRPLTAPKLFQKTLGVSSSNSTESFYVSSHHATSFSHSRDSDDTFKKPN